MGSFRLRENDYVFGGRKFGGNAQAISKGRWVHHTSFLWDYQPESMRLLKQPSRRPAYRGDRAHEAFVCRLKEALPDRRGFVDALTRLPELAGWDVVETSLEEAEAEVLGRRHLRSTRVVEILEDGSTREGQSRYVNTTEDPASQTS